MESLLIESKINSPEVNFDALTGVLKITGRSIPEHPVKFYEPIESWMDSFLSTNPPKITLHIFLDYLNTHSTECVILLMKAIMIFSKKNTTSNVLVEWCYEEDDEDMEDLGQDLASITGLPFNYEKILE